MKKEEKEWFVTYGFHYNPLKFKKITNRQYRRDKPDGGLWSSPEKSEFGWAEWCKSEEFFNNNFALSCGFKFTLKKSAKVLKVNELADVKKYIHNLNAIGGMITFPEIDWEVLFSDYDALYLTEEGLFRAKGLFDDTRDGESMYNIFNFWDVPTLLLGNLEAIDEISNNIKTYKV